jgi:glucan phosphoethanolaminetransferase (alkaline phosphatase superfamily)
MSYLHLIFGIVIFIIFLITGQYMRADFPNKEVIPQEFRLLMRSRHIYILLAALLHVALGIYIQIRQEVWRKSLQIFGSVLLFAGTAALVWAFVYETYAAKTFSEASRSGLYLTLAGTIFHFLGGFRVKSKTNE